MDRGRKLAGIVTPDSNDSCLKNNQKGRQKKKRFSHHSTKQSDSEHSSFLLQTWTLLGDFSEKYSLDNLRNTVSKI